jgi:hypothetical protein
MLQKYFVQNSYTVFQNIAWPANHMAPLWPQTILKINGTYLSVPMYTSWKLLYHLLAARLHQSEML